MPLISEASQIFLGTIPVDAIYAREQKVFPSRPPEGPMGTPWKMDFVAGAPVTFLPSSLPSVGYSHSWNGSDLILNFPIPETFLDTVSFYTTNINIGNPGTIHPYVGYPPPDANYLFSKWHISIPDLTLLAGGGLFSINLYWEDEALEVQWQGGTFFTNAYSVPPNPILWIPPLIQAEWHPQSSYIYPTDLMRPGHYFLEVSYFAEGVITAPVSFTIHTAQTEWSFGYKEMT